MVPDYMSTDTDCPHVNFNMVCMSKLLSQSHVQCDQTTELSVVDNRPVMNSNCTIPCRGISISNSIIIICVCVYVQVLIHQWKWAIVKPFILPVISVSNMSYHIHSVLAGGYTQLQDTIASSAPEELSRICVTSVF